MDQNKKDNLRTAIFFGGIYFLYTVSLSHINISIGGALTDSEHIMLYVLECLSMGIGFLFCPIVLNKPGGGEKWRRIVLIVSLIIFCITAFILHFVTTGPFMRLAVVYEMFSMGIIAGYGYVIVSNKTNNNPLIGMLVAGGYSIAIFSQFVFQLKISIGVLFPALEAAICVLIVMYEIRYPGMFEDEDDRACSIKDLRPKGGMELLRLVIIAICLLALSSYVDEQMAVTIDVSRYFSWPRLMYIPGSLIMGFAWSYRRARIAPVVMLLTAVAAFLMPVLLTDEAFYGFDMCVFYLYIGISMTYMTLIFMKFADLSGNSFVAVLFRALDNLMTVLFVILGLGRISALAMIIVDVVLLIIIVALMWIGGDFELSMGYERRFFAGMASDNEGTNTDISDDDRISNFAARYGLTDRESEALKLLLTRDEKGEVMARELGVSRRGFVSFTTSIYQKTGTGSRIALLQKYMSE